MGPAATRTKLTPPKVARRYGVSPEKVIGWIRRGELHAMNAATRLDGRPRYLIDIRDLEAFELRRSATPVPKSKRRRQELGITEYF